MKMASANLSPLAASSARRDVHRRRQRHIQRELHGVRVRCRRGRSCGHRQIISGRSRECGPDGLTAVRRRMILRCRRPGTVHTQCTTASTSFRDSLVLSVIMARFRDVLIDLAVAAVIVAFGAAFFVARRNHTALRRQREGDCNVGPRPRSGSDRVAAGPDRERPELLHNSVVPVLVDEGRLAPQQLAMNDTPVVVTQGSQPPLNVTALRR